MKSEICDCEPAYTEHEFESRITSYHVICKKCKRHIGWYSWLPKEGMALGNKAGVYVKENFNPY